MNFLIMIVVFFLGLFLLMFGNYVKNNIISKLFYFVGACGVLLAMYIAWPK